jgi:hypothetical protein
VWLALRRMNTNRELSIESAQNSLYELVYGAPNSFFAITNPINLLMQYLQQPRTKDALRRYLKTPDV